MHLSLYSSSKDNILRDIWRKYNQSTLFPGCRLFSYPSFNNDKYCKCAGTIFYSVCAPHPDPIWQCKLVANYLLSSSVFGLEGEARNKIDLLRFTFFPLEKYKNSTCVMFQFSSGNSYQGIILNKVLWRRLDS